MNQDNIQKNKRVFKPKVMIKRLRPQQNYNKNFQKKVTIYRTKDIGFLHYMNKNYLLKCLTPLNSILSRSITKHNNKYQRQLSSHIKIARFLGLIPYTL